MLLTGELIELIGNQQFIGIWNNDQKLVRELLGQST